MPPCKLTLARVRVTQWEEGVMVEAREAQLAVVPCGVLSTAGAIGGLQGIRVGTVH